jgi:purine nucleosidase
MNSLPIFSENDLKKPYSQGRPRNSVVMYADCLSHSKAPITFVTTGPLTNIANLLRERANLSDHIEEILITGGAINIPGNVHEEGYEDSAEWNIFADPKAFKSILETRIPIKLIPFDVGSQLPVTKAFRQKLERQAKDHKASELALKLYSLVSTFTYHMMDVLTAIIAVDSSVATFKKMRIDVAQSGKSMGKTGKSFFNGREVEVATAVDVKRVEDKVLSALRSN